MPASLMDMFSGRAPLQFSPRDYAGNQIGMGDAIAQHSNSLVGLGMGLLQPHMPGESPYANALQGYQVGSVADSRRGYQQAQLQHQKAQEARQAANDAFQRSQAAQSQRNWEQQFARSGESDFAKIARDLNLKPGTPEYGEAARKYVQDKTEPPAIVWQEDANGNKVPYLQNPRSPTNPITQLPIPGAPPAGGGNPYGAAGKMTTDEGKTALFADRAASAHAAITKAENINQEPGGTVGALVQQNLPAGVANAIVSGERGKAMDAQRAFINALLRRESGAAISSGEFDSYSKEYFPQYGDKPDQIEAKRKHRAEVIAGLARESGRGYRPTYSFDQNGNITLGTPTYAGKGGSTPPAPPPTTTEAAPSAAPAPTAGRGGSAPPRPANVPTGSAYSPSRNQWKLPDGTIVDASGRPI